MSQAEEYERGELGPAEAFGPEAGRNGSGRREYGGQELRPVPAPRESAPAREPLTPREPVGRPLGSPLPVGGVAKGPVPVGHEEVHAVRTGPPPPGRSLSGPRGDVDSSSGTQWMSALMQAMPFMQRLLPLIDGNLASALSNLGSARPLAAQPAPRVDLQPIETGMADLKGQQLELHTQILEHNGALKRVEDQLEMVREATDRNTLEQQELIEDLKTMGSRVNTFALTLLALLVLSILLNLLLFLHIQRVLP